MSSVNTSLDNDVSPSAEHRDEDDVLSDGDGIEYGEASPSKRRKRTGDGERRPMSVSCELCKQRKVKCDRGHPQCGWCRKNGQLCEYKERKKPGLRAGYGRELEARLDKLEHFIQAQNTVIQQLVSNLPGQPLNVVDEVPQLVPYVGTPTGVDNSIYPQPPRESPAGEQSSDGAQSHPNVQMSLDALNVTKDCQNVQMLPPASPEQPYAASHSTIATPGLDILHDDRPSKRYGVAAVSLDHEFPPYDMLYALTDLFFQHINTWCPILHRKTVLNSLFGSSTLDEADRILLHSIVATTLRFSTDPRLTEQSRTRYHAVSKQKVLLYGLENSSVKALQALVILALDIVGSSNGPPGWNLLALVTRSIVQLGLAVEATSTSVAPLFPSIYTLRAMVLPEPNTFIEDESRRRLFWMVYLLDRYATIATAFEFALDEKEIDRKLPCRDELFARNQPVETRWFRTTARSDHIEDHPQNLGSFSYYVEIVGILSQIHRFLKKPVDIGSLSDVEQWQSEYRQLDNKLKTWKFNLPAEYGTISRLFDPNGGSKMANCVLIMLHITYHTTVIRLHSSAAYPTTRSPIFTPSFSASQRCLAAVDDICSLCTYVRNNSVLTKLGPPFAFSLWVAARLLLVHGSTIDRQVSPAIHPLVETLREMGFYWQVAERYATLLQRVLDEYQESERAPAGANGLRETPSTVRILADMRRCAYDLDVLISRQPRQYFGAKSNAAVTPARTPAPNELEYLDVFDFFNMPRLPVPAGFTGATDVGDGLGNSNHGRDAGTDFPASLTEATNGNNEFNITNFIYDANSDWFMNSSTPGT